VGQPVDGGKSGIGDVTPGGQGEEVLSLLRCIAVDGKGIGQCLYPFFAGTDPVKKLLPGDPHILLVLDKARIPAVQPGNEGQAAGIR
jgi:hypothetical protein